MSYGRVVPGLNSHFVYSEAKILVLHLLTVLQYISDNQPFNCTIFVQGIRVRTWTTNTYVEWSVGGSMQGSKGIRQRLSTSSMMIYKITTSVD